MSIIEKTRQKAPAVALSTRLEVLEVNPAARDIVGREVMGRKCYELLGRKRPHPRCPALRALREWKPAGQLVSCCLLSGEWLVEAIPVRAGRRKAVCLLYHKVGVDEIKRLLGEVEKTQKALKRAIGVFSAVGEARDPQSILAKVPETIASLLELDGACVLTRDPSVNLLEVTSGIGIPAYGVTMSPDEVGPLADLVGEGGKVKVIQPGQLGDRLGRLTDLVGEGSHLLAVGLGEVEGVIAVWRHSLPFERGEVWLIRSFAKALDIALRNAKVAWELMEKSVALTRELETTRLLHDIDRIALSPLDTQKRNEMLTAALSKFGTADVCVMLATDGGRYKALHAFRRGSPASVSRKSFSFPGLRELLSRNVPVSIPDASVDPVGASLKEALGLTNIRSFLIMPIHARRALKGAVVWGSEAPAAFGPDILGRVALILPQVNLAFERSRLQGELRSMFLAAVTGFSTAIDARSRWTRGHSERVAEIAVAIGSRMGLKGEEMETLTVGALLHDVGKIYVPPEILDKPGKLTEREWEVIKKHPIIGEEILLGPKERMEWMRHTVEGAIFLSELRKDLGSPMARFAPIARSHHENWDGTGYPDGLKGEEIPFLARVVRVADAFEAMTADRPYRRPLPPERAVEEIEDGRGKEFDPEVVEAFVASFQSEALSRA